MYQNQINYDECYSTDYFENQDLEHICCPIGLGVVNNPVFDPCGHVFCLYCITKCLDKKQECPLNKNQQLNKDSLTPALSIKNLVLNLQLKQCFQNCGWKGKLDQFSKHKHHQCPETLIECQNEECSDQFLRKNMDQHICPFHLVDCEDCKQPIKHSQLLDHKNVCPSIQINCDSCNMQLQRQFMENHVLMECIERMTKCQIQGCDIQLKYKDQIDHLRNDVNHIFLLQNQIKVLQQRLEEGMQQNQAMENLKAQIQKQPPFLDGWKCSVSKKQSTREWETFNSIEKCNWITGAFEFMEGCDWNIELAIIKLFMTHVYILGGLKCAGKQTPEKYGKELDGDFKLTLTLNRQCELIFDHNQETLGPAFKLDKDLVQQGSYLIISLINIGKIKIDKLFHL